MIILYSTLIIDLKHQYDGFYKMDHKTLFHCRSIETDLNYEVNFKNKTINKNDLIEIIKDANDVLEKVYSSIDDNTSILSYKVVYSNPDHPDFYVFEGSGLNVDLINKKYRGIFLEKEFYNKCKNAFDEILRLNFGAKYFVNLRIYMRTYRECEEEREAEAMIEEAEKED
jgi:hypothetical protein